MNVADFTPDRPHGGQNPANRVAFWEALKRLPVVLVVLKDLDDDKLVRAGEWKQHKAALTGLEEIEVAVAKARDRMDRYCNKGKAQSDSGKSSASRRYAGLDGYKE